MRRKQMSAANALCLSSLGVCRETAGEKRPNTLGRSAGHPAIRGGIKQAQTRLVVMVRICKAAPLVHNDLELFITVYLSLNGKMERII